MARVSSIITNFRAGEISPRLEGRIDLQKYNEAVKNLSNMIVFPQGGVTRRPGTYYAGTTKDGGKVRLINFEFSDTQAYVLEFGNNYIRIFKDGGLVTAATTAISAITKANPAVVTSNSHGMSNGDRVFVTGVVGMTQVNNREFTVAGVATNTFQLSGINSSAFTAYGSAGTTGEIIEVTTTYTLAQLATINFSQSADVLHLAHLSHAPAKLTRTSHTAWTLGDIDFTDGPYLDENITDTTLYASANTGSVTVTASASLFVSTDVGRLIRFREIIAAEHDEWAASTGYAQNVLIRFGDNVYKKTDSGTDTSGATPPVHLTGSKVYGPITWQFQHSGSGFLKITGFTSVTIVTATFKNSTGFLPASVVSSGNATTLWSLGSFSTTTGFPRAIGFYEERLYFASTTTQPQTIFGSVSADFENHTPGINDDDAINVTIASDKVNVIKHLLPARFLQLLTTSSEFTLSGGAGSEPVTPTNVNVLRETTFGTGDIKPLRAGNSTIIIQKGGEKVKEITFDLDTDGLLGVDLTVLADHLARGGLTDMVWQQEPELLLWFVHTDGRLIGLTYDRANATIGWHEHSLGGSGIVESITAIPSGAEDQVYLSVKRTINSVVVRHIVFLKSLYFNDDVEDAFFVDSGLTYDGSAVTTITGLNHLEGVSVTILADGSAHANKTVVKGTITLDRSSSKVHIGYGYTSSLETLRMEAGAEDGIAQGKIKRIHGVTARFFQTVGAELGPDNNNLDRLPFRDSSMSMDQAVPLFNGDKEISFPSGYDNDAKIVIRQTQPLPMTILAIMRRSNTFDA
tara:strand:+ start:665 stop:3064 length:2400 start_codon:yes stop_codon:yes gene_type:complete